MSARQQKIRNRVDVSLMLMPLVGRFGAAAKTLAAAPDAFASMPVLMHFERAFRTGTIRGRTAKHTFVLIALMLMDLMWALGTGTVAARSAVNALGICIR